MDALEEQVHRTFCPFPTLRIARQVPDIDSFAREDLELTGYDPHPLLFLGEGEKG